MEAMSVKRSWFRARDAPFSRPVQGLALYETPAEQVKAIYRVTLFISRRAVRKITL
jgi:hypothetical protein